MRRIFSTIICILIATFCFGQVFLPEQAKKEGGKAFSEHPCYLQIDNFINDQKSIKIEPTQLSKKDYLEIVANEVAVMSKYQNEQGQIIDPVQKIEWQYATPCYAHCVAGLLAAKYPYGEKFKESGIRAFNVSLDAMLLGNKFIPQGHGDFFTFPMMKAFSLYKDFVPTAMYEIWREKLSKINPQLLYASQKGKGNWNIVNLAGEFYRAKASMTDDKYYETLLENKKAEFTAHGMFSEHGEPLAYDLFPRYFLTKILQDGYRGPSFDFYRNIIWRGAWTSLFMMSPTGEAPTGYRSSNHLWNEAESAAIFEMIAAQYALLNKDLEAGAFKRAAHLSLQAIKRWIRRDGSGYVVKNRYPIEAQHGYEKYSSHSQYNLLASSMLITAWQMAVDDIKEKPCPADVGGYIVSIEPFHKVFVNVAGNYLEFETDGDLGYNPTGIIRVHLKGVNPQLGPSDGCAEIFSGKGNNYAVGPFWTAQGTVSSLAQKSKFPKKIEVLKQNTSTCEFRITKRFPISKSSKDTLMVVENILMNKKGLKVSEYITGKVDTFGITFPALVFDGENKYPIALNKNSLLLGDPTTGIKVNIDSPRDLSWVLKPEMIGHRNGEVQIAIAQKACISTISFTISHQ